MFNVGGPEILVIILVALVVLGPDQLPKAMRTFGNVMAEIRKVSSGFQTEMRNAMNSVETSVERTVAGDGSSRSGADANGAGASNGRGGAGSTASTPAEADVTEIVARNRPDQDARTIDPVSDRPPVDPADRAAG